MSSIRIMRRAIRALRNPEAPKATVRHNQRGWLRAIALLGDRWVGLSVNRPSGPSS